MVATKVKSNTSVSQVVGDRVAQRSAGTVGNISFKVFSDKQRVKDSASDSVDANTMMKSAPDNGGAIHTNAKDNLKIYEKRKAIHGTSVKANIARRALADVSNVQGRSRIEVQDRLKSVKGERSASIQRVSTCSGSSSLSASSRKPLTGQVSKILVKGVGINHASKRDIKDLKVSPNNQRTKNQGRESADTGGSRMTVRKPNDQRTKGQGCEFSDTANSMTARKPPLPTRKSLPVKVNQLDRSNFNAKDSAETSQKGKGKIGFPVKTNVGGKLVSQVTNVRRHVWKNRVSDGFIMMASKNQMNADARALSRKPPIMKNTLTASKAQKSTKLTCISSSNRSTSAAATVSSKKKSGVTTSFCPKKHTNVVDEPAQGELQSDGKNASKNKTDLIAKKNSECIRPTTVVDEPARGELQSDGQNASKNKTDLIAKKKSERRRSYTSLLMAKSKLLEEHGEVTKQEKLPSIDNECNQLEVSEYVDDIYEFYWVTEVQYPSLADYMAIQTDITPAIRGILINWLIEVHFKFDLMQETLYLMVSLLDRYLSQVTIKKNELQLVGLTALLLASKYEDFWHPRIKDLISISAESYSRDQMLGMEKLILRKLKFRLNVPTPYVFMLRFLKAAQSNAKLEHLAFYLIELCLVQYEALQFKPSLLCASAIYVARCTLQMNPAWTPLLGKHARYEESQIKDCAKMILRYHKAARTMKLNVTYEKYLRPDHNSVATMKPLERLPF